MSTNTLTQHNNAHDNHGHHDAGATKVFGFWVYLMSDLILFASLFAIYVVLKDGTAGGPTGKEILTYSLYWWKPSCCYSAVSPTALPCWQ